MKSPVETMAALHFFFLFALVACGSANVFTDERIIGGDIAPEGLAPFAVSLRTGLILKSHFCGGSLISTKFVVTAAHCVDAVWSSGIIGGGSLSNSLQVLSGTQNTNSGGVKSNVKSNFTHGSWDSHNLVYDIGIFELSTEIVQSALQKPITINSNVIPGGEELTAVGWGWTKYPSGSGTTQLKYLKTNSLDYDTCAAMRDVAAGQFPGFFPIIYYPQEICVYKAVGEAVCKGDSGSALYNNDGLVGIVSWGLPCAAGAPDVFTRVSTFADWINAVTGV